MRVHLTTLCGCHKEMELPERELTHLISIPIAFPTPYTELGGGRGATYEKRVFELVGYSNYPAAYYEEVKA
jgi:hypothetical protein